MANIPGDTAAAFLVENLLETIKHNSDALGGIRDNVEEICKGLEKLKALIKDCTKKQENNEILGNLISEIKTVIYEAEDAIETYIVRSSLRKRRSYMSIAFHAIDDASELRRVTRNIESVTKYVQNIYKNMVPVEISSVQLDEISSTGRQSEKIVTVEEDYVVGGEDMSEELIELLTGESEQLEVISIVGTLGLGKTTLAKRILDEPKIQSEFSVRAFVYVSQEYRRREVFLRVLNSLTHVGEEMNKMSDEQLVEVIQEKLQNQKYLIVMDDIWTSETWDDLKVAFPNNDKHSRVVITSRSTSVARHANPKIDPYFMRFLYPEESRELLQRKIFGLNSCPPQFEEYEIRILQRCDGLPLAILQIAGILANYGDSIGWWKKVYHSMTDFVARDMSEMIDVIKMSFNLLPHHLKPCFLYMGVFRQNFDIPVRKLLLLWIAEGFIEHHPDISLEDAAEYYLKELIDKNLVMVESRRWDGRIKTCRIHCTLHEFCKKEALKENLFLEVKRFDQVKSLSASTSSGNYRRLCVNDSVLDYMRSTPSGTRARTFLCFANEKIHLPFGYVPPILRAFKLLRVLEIRSVFLTRLPSAIIQLILLKYIAISCNFKIVPEKISDLGNLQTLIIETSSLTLDIRADIWKMKQLRHLRTNASTYLLKFEDEPLLNENLQTLSTISPESCRKDVLERTPMLKKLGIYGKLANLIDATGQSSLFDSLLKLEELEIMKLLNVDPSLKLQALPQPDMFPRKLRKLTLLNTSLEWRHMSILGKLEKLEMLKLKDKAFLGSIWETEDGGFQNLRALHIGHTDLKQWKASASHFPALRSLLVQHCPELEAIPPGLGDISTLQEIKLQFNGPKLATSAREIQEKKSMEVQEQQNSTKTFGFKLIVFPPDHNNQ